MLLSKLKNKKIILGSASPRRQELLKSLGIDFEIRVKDLKEKYPDMDISVVPGIVSIFSFASKVGISVAEGAEKVAIIPSCYDLSSVKEIAKHTESMIFLKDGRYFDQVIAVLKESGFPDNSLFAIGQDLGTDHEIIRTMTLGEVNDDTLTTKYFSILVVKRV